MGRQHVEPGKQAKKRRQQTAADNLESQIARLGKDLSIGPKDPKDKTALKTYIRNKVTEAKALFEAGCDLGPKTTTMVKDYDKVLREAKKKAEAEERARKKAEREQAEKEHEEQRRGR